MNNKKRLVAIISNEPSWTYNLRGEIIETLLNNGYRVALIVGYGEKLDPLIEKGCEFYDVPVERHGVNPLHEISLLHQYKRILQRIKPDVVFSYTIKPNIYGAIACRKYNIPIITNITGLGTAVEYGGIKQKIALLLYRYAFRDVKKVFFQNKENMAFFADHNLALGKHDLLPGSGVNLERFPALPYPDDDIVRFVFIARIMKEKGIDYYLESAKYIKAKYPNTEFHVCGFVEAEYEGKLDEYAKAGLIVYHGMVRDIKSVHEQMHCTVFPSYYPEGLSNVLLEAAACARPIITTNRAGCREAIDDGITGILIPTKDQKALNNAMDRFMQMTFDEKKQMGLAGRKKVEQEFDRSIVVNKYLECM